MFQVFLLKIIFIFKSFNTIGVFFHEILPESVILFSIFVTCFIFCLLKFYYSVMEENRVDVSCKFYE